MYSQDPAEYLLSIVVSLVPLVLFHIVTTCPSTGAWRGTQWCVFKGRKTCGVATNVYSRKTSKKPKWKKVEGLRILKTRVRELFTHGEGISTPRAHHKGWQPLIECANHDFNIIYFPFYLYFPFLYFFTFLSFLCFLLFWTFYVFYFFVPFYVFYFFVIDKGVYLTPTYSSIAMRK